MLDPNAWQKPTYYSSDKHSRLILPFPRSESIKRNFSQCYQDLFVLTVLEGKRNGTYLEIGAGDPFESSNTALLEMLGWEGVSLEINESLINRFAINRRNLIVCADATIIDYEELFYEINFNDKKIDYLQVDCEPPEVTFNALMNIRHDIFRFRVITFEHDCYNGGAEVMAESRLFLKRMGYILAASNISVDEYHPYEDWWVCPDLVKCGNIKKIFNSDAGVKMGEKFMFGEYL